MAKQISELTSKATPVGADEIEIQETGGGTSKKATLQSVWNQTFSTPLPVSGTTGSFSDLVSAVKTSSGAEVKVQELRNNATATNTAVMQKFVNSTVVGSNSGSVELVATRTGTNTGEYTIRVADASAVMQDALTVDSAGNLAVPSGGGIDFSAAGGGVFDQYISGTAFTPVVADASSGGNTGTFTNTSRYLRWGDLFVVFVEMINIDTTGMTSGNDLYIRNLPITLANNGINPQGGIMCGAINFVSTPLTISAVGNANTSFVTIQEALDNASIDLLTVGELTSGSADIIFTLICEAA